MPERAINRLFTIEPINCDKCYVSNAGICTLCDELTEFCSCPNLRQKRVIDASNEFIRRVQHLQSHRINHFAHRFSVMKSKWSQYIVCPFFTVAECQELKAYSLSHQLEPWKSINDFMTGLTTSRYQQAFLQYWTADSHKKVGNNRLSKFPFSFQRFITVFKLLHPGTGFITAKLLKTVAPCKEQHMHADEGSYLEREPGKVLFNDVPFSMIIELEDSSNPTYLYIKVNEDVHKVLVPQGHVLVFRGDVVHAGAELENHTENIRCFIATGTLAFIHNGKYVLTVIETEDVDVVTNEV